MCGRFSRSRPIKDYAEYFQAEPTQSNVSSFNVCPSDDVLAVVADSDQYRHLTWFHWGLVPSWSKGPDSRFSMINARAETLTEKPAYRTAFHKRRCIIIADGFYEWKRTATGKQPYFCTLRSGEPMSLAGLWEHWTAEDGSQSIFSTTIITTDANRLMLPIHNRMPVILPPDQLSHWLNPQETDTASLQPLLAPLNSEVMDAWPVSTKVNSPKHNGPELISPI